MRKCPDCNVELYEDYVHGYYVCRCCGLISEDKVYEVKKEVKISQMERRSKHLRNLNNSRHWVKQNKPIYVRVEIHMELKKYANKNKKSMVEVASEAILEYILGDKN